MDEAKTYLDDTSKKQELKDSDFKHFMELIFEEQTYVRSLQKEPKQWVDARKDMLKKTITYANGKSIEPKLDSFESVKPRFFPKNALQFKSECDPEDTGAYGIGNNIIEVLKKYS